MGAAIAAEAQETKGVEITGLFESPKHGAVGGKIAGVPVSGGVKDASAGADVIVDFTAPEATIECARWCAAEGKAMVVGTTGFTPAQVREMESLAGSFACVMAPNMSVGVNLLEELARLAAEKLEGFDTAIVETHHAAKKDAPSGTAAALARAVAAGGGKEPDTLSVRGGTAAGDHTVMFLGGGERVLLSHVAEDRKIFASGAVKAAVWVCGKPPGIYGMREVLGLGC